MKMVDAWLLFNLLYPFIVVLIHTYMDTLRNDEEREINHHGKTITVGENDAEEIIKDSGTDTLINGSTIITTNTFVSISLFFFKFAI